MNIDTIKDRLFTENRGVNTIIAVALLVLISVGFAVAFQQIGTGFIDSVNQPVQATVDAEANESAVDLTIQSTSENVDVMRIRGTVADRSFDSSDSGDWSEVTTGDSTAVTGLSQGDEVLVVARDNPDNTGVVLRYVHG